MYCVVVKSITTAVRGTTVGWGKLERKATVAHEPAPPSARRPLPLPTAVRRDSPITTETRVGRVDARRRPTSSVDRVFR